MGRISAVVLSGLMFIGSPANGEPGRTSGAPQGARLATDTRITSSGDLAIQGVADNLRRLKQQGVDVSKTPGPGTPTLAEWNAQRAKESEQRHGDSNWVVSEMGNYEKDMVPALAAIGVTSATIAQHRQYNQQMLKGSTQEEVTSAGLAQRQLLPPEQAAKLREYMIKNNIRYQIRTGPSQPR